MRCHRPAGLRRTVGAVQHVHEVGGRRVEPELDQVAEITEGFGSTQGGRDIIRENTADESGGRMSGHGGHYTS